MSNPGGPQRPAHLSSSGLGLGGNDEPRRPGPPLAPTGVAAEADVRAHSPGAAALQREPASWAADLGELPAGYGDGRLVLLPRDPTCAFVYWDLSRHQLQQASAGARLRLVSPDGALLREEEVDPGWQGVYLRGLPAGAEFRAELLAMGEQGLHLLRVSRLIRLPPDEPSPLDDEQYLTVALATLLTGAPLVAGRPRIWSELANFPGWVGPTGSRERGGGVHSGSARPAPPPEPGEPR